MVAGGTTRCQDTNMVRFTIVTKYPICKSLVLVFGGYFLFLMVIKKLNFLLNATIELIL